MFKEKGGKKAKKWKEIKKKEGEKKENSRQPLKLKRGIASFSLFSNFHAR